MCEAQNPNFTGKAPKCFPVGELSVGLASAIIIAVSAAEVIEEIKQLPPGDQAQVIQFAVELARTRQLSPEELGELADQLANATDPAEITRLRSAMTRGFYGE